MITEHWPDWISDDIARMVSVDVETSGPNPADYDLLSIGACTLAVPQHTFYVELQPVTKQSTVDSQRVHGLDLDQLTREGENPAQAMEMFDSWLFEAAGKESPPLFVGFNAPFDWMFVSDYFHRYLGRNPFGHSALDIKSFFMGYAKVPWSGTSMKNISIIELKHNALQDACDQAELFKKIVMHAV